MRDEGMGREAELPQTRRRLGKAGSAMPEPGVSPRDFVIAGLRYRLTDVCAATLADLESRLPEFQAEDDGVPDAPLLLGWSKPPKSAEPRSLRPRRLTTSRLPDGGVRIRRADFEGCGIRRAAKLAAATCTASCRWAPS